MTLHNPKPAYVFLIQSLSLGVLHYKTIGRGSLGARSETSTQLVSHLRILPQHRLGARAK